MRMVVGKPPDPNCDRCQGTGKEPCCCGDPLCSEPRWSCMCTWVEAEETTDWTSAFHQRVAKLRSAGLVLPGIPERDDTTE